MHDLSYLTDHYDEAIARVNGIIDDILCGIDGIVHKVVGVVCGVVFAVAAGGEGEAETEDQKDGYDFFHKVSAPYLY